MGLPPDVRVRLSAEGQAEVIAAFRKIQQEADRTGRVGAKGLSALSGAVSTLGRLLPALTFGAAIAGATALAKRSLDAGENFAKLAERTGVSVESISAWSHAADISETDSESLAKGLARLSKNMAASAQGGDEQRRAFERVGISQKELQSGSLTLDQTLLRVSKHISEQPDGWRKSAEAQALFGKSGADLVPFLNQGPEGLKQLREEAERLGLVWSTEAAVAADQFNDNLRRLRGTVDGFVNQILSGAVPAMTDLTQGLLDTSQQAGTGKSRFQELGQTVANVAKWIVAGFFSAGLTIGDFFLKTGAVVAGFGILVDDLGHGRIRGSLANFRKTLTEEFEAISRSSQFTFDNFTRKLNLEGDKPTPLKPPKPKGGTEPPLIDEAARTRALSALKQFEDARLALAQGALANELALAKAHSAALEAEEKKRFEQGLTGVEDFFAKRRAALESEAAAEIALLQQQAGEIGKQIADVAARPRAKHEEPKAREAEIAKLVKDRHDKETEAEIRTIKLRQDLNVLTVEQTTEVRKASTEQLQAEAEIAEAQGRRFDAERASLDAQIAGLQRLKGETDEAFAGRQKALFDAGEARIQFEEIQAQSRIAFADLDQRRLQIEALVQRGVISQLEGERTIAQLESDRLPNLQAIAAAMRAAAFTPEQIEAARQLEQELTRLGVSADLAGRRMAEFKAAVESALTSDLANFFTQGIDQAHGFADAMRAMALSVVNSLRQIASQMLATIIIAQIMKAVLGFVAGAASGTITTSSTGAGGVSPLAGAMGGLIHGPGGPTGDKIPALLSDREFVVRAASVSQPGALHFLQAVNQNPALWKEVQEAIVSFGTLRIREMPRLRGYRDGGLVEGAHGAPGMAGHTDLNIGLDTGLLLEKISNDSNFRRIIIRTLSENPKAVRAAIRG